MIILFDTESYESHNIIIMFFLLLYHIFYILLYIYIYILVIEFEEQKKSLGTDSWLVSTD